MGKRLTTKEFIKRAKEVHGDNYDYSISNYIGSQHKIKIICPIHNIFEQIAFNHLNGFGCSKCGHILTSVKKTSNTNDFILKASLIHNNKYDYSLVDFKNCKLKVKIICKQHGIFEQTSDNHINKSKGCPKCANIFRGNKLKLTHEEFITKAREIHGNKYDYSLINYVNNQTNIIIICQNHGEFLQKPVKHLSNHGCPICKSSKGEILISNLLNKNNIEYIPQHRFNDCRDKNPLPFDFYLPNHNICIEFNGRQHYEIVEYFGGFNQFKNQQRNDKIKEDYCKHNNIRLIAIKHTDNIKTILVEELDMLKD